MCTLPPCPQSITQGVCTQSMLSMNLCMVEWESQKASQLPCPVSPSCGGSFVGSGSRGQRDSWGSGLSHAGYLGEISSSFQTPKDWDTTRTPAPWLSSCWRSLRPPCPSAPVSVGSEVHPPSLRMSTEQSNHPSGLR